jgi:micrococcal nuclease
MELYLTADDIPGGLIRSHRAISGRVVSVSDGDTFRFRHLPSIVSSGKYDGKLSENTITLRIAAVDTPETAKFGKPGMRLGEEAKEFAKARVLNKRVRVRCYSRDQYGRIVGTLEYGGPGPWARDLSTQLLQNGLASVYRQAGAVYGGRSLDGWDKIEEKAQQKRLGIWSEGVEKAELSSDFKAKQKAKQKK